MGSVAPPSLIYPESAPVALGGATPAAQVTADRGLFAGQVARGSAVYALLRWSVGLASWAAVRVNGQTVRIEPNAQVADGTASVGFDAIPDGYYGALLLTAQPDGSGSNLMGLEVANAGQAGGGGGISTASDPLEIAPADNVRLRTGTTPGDTLVWSGTAWVIGPPSAVVRLIETRTSDTAYTLGDSVRLVPGSGGHVEVGAGSAPGSSVGIIGIYNASGLAGSSAPIVTFGQTDPIPGCPDGAAFRSATGAAVDMGGVVPAAYTNQLGVGDGNRITVSIGPEVQK